MARTGHCPSAGVRSYKRVTEHLKEKTSDILNLRAVESRSKPADTEKVNQTMISKENTDPASGKMAHVSFSGASNFTVNFHL